MKYLPLLWAGLWRKPIRTVLTLLSIVVAFLLFGLLQGVLSGFDGALSKMSDTRLRVMNRANMLETLPIAYEARIARLPGVQGVTHATILIAYYQEPKNGFSVAALGFDTAADIFPEMKVPAEQFDALGRTRTGALVGIELARRFDWQIGDRVTVHSSNWVKQDGSGDWPVDIVGFVNAGPDDDKVFANEMYIRYDYLDEARATGKGTVHQYMVAIDDAEQATAISTEIDSLFANSSNETTTMNEKEYVVAQFRQIGNIRLFVYSIISAVLFTLLFLAGNTMAQSVRDRISEIGVLKTLGFSDSTVWRLVVIEAAVLCLLASFLGLAIAALAFPSVFGALGLGPLPLSPRVYLAGFGIALAVAVISASIPALRAKRLTIVDALSGR
ncbi:MAG: ABC transporter permease [Pseudomonadales bacterium]